MSPRSKEQLEELRENTREKIFEAALELFGTKGFSRTSVSDIVKAAGISKGLMYHYFDSKEDLLRKMIAHFEKNESRMIHAIESEDPQVMLQNILHLFFHEMRENFAFWRLLTNLTSQVEHFDFIHEIATRKIRDYLMLFEQLFTQLGWENPKDEAMILAAILDGIGIQYYALKNDYHLDAIEQALTNKYLK